MAESISGRFAENLRHSALQKDGVSICFLYILFCYKEDNGRGLWFGAEISGHGKAEFETIKSNKIIHFHSLFFLALKITATLFLVFLYHSKFI